MTNGVVRYSDTELEEFKSIIETRLAKAREQLNSLNEQILEITENSSDEHGGDWVDDSSINNDVEMLNNMAIRQWVYIQDLENALVRIHNKTYGICSVTGELIDKRRLVAVPTTTKSLAAKTAGLESSEIKSQQVEEKPERPAVAAKPTSVGPKVITKIKRKPTNPPKAKPIEEEDDYLFGEDIFFDDDEDTPLRRPIDEDIDDIADDTPDTDDQEEEDY
jgi:RNA polymerase-binding transcription factor DksA